MAPYRSRTSTTPAVAPTTGVVAEMVRQFADPYAFLRELVQNSIDAGATAIDVRLEHLSTGVTTTAITDDGSGMTRAIMEGPLLTVFSTSKEGQKGKIGKYGVGFVSVLALDPDEVVIESWRDGAAHRVRLRRDHTYELEAIDPRAGSGTVVTLVQRGATDAGQEAGRAAFERHAALCLGALRRWCRHAQVPVHLATHVEGRPEAARARVDVPLAVHALVSVRDEDDGTVVLLGASAGSELLSDPPADGAELAQTYAGFFNRGLMLHETTEPLAPELAGLRLKVMSPSLVHTLSRDDVKRDAVFRAVLARVVKIARGALRAELARRLAAAAREGSERALDEHVALLVAATRPPLALAARQVPLPLLEPLGGHRALSAPEIVRRSANAVALYAERSTAVTRALAREGRPVVRSHGESAAILVQLAGEAEDAGARHFVLAPLDASESGASDEALCASLCDALAAAGARVRGVALGRMLGRTPLPCLSLPAGAGGGGEVLLRSDELPNLLRPAARKTLHAIAGTPAVDAARIAARKDPALAAMLLARTLLLDLQGPLGPEGADGLLALAASELA